MRQGIPDMRDGMPWAGGSVLLVLLLGAVAHAGGGSVMAEASAGGEQRTWTVLGDVEVRRETTFLTLGYAGARPTTEEAVTHQLSGGVDHGLSEHWLVSGVLNVGLPKTTTLPLAPARPGLGLPALDFRGGFNSQGVQLAASYDSAGFSDREYGVDLGLGLTRYGLRRELRTRTREGDTQALSEAREALVLVRPSLGGRLLLGDAWELGLRGSFSLYSENPVSVGDFTPEELQQVVRRYADMSEAGDAVRKFIKRRIKAFGVDLTGRTQSLDALTGFPSAPVRFEFKPSVTYRFGARLRGQLSYAFTRYMPGQGYAHVVGMRWTWRVAKPLRLWAALALQADHVAGEPSVRSGLGTLGTEYTF